MVALIAFSCSEDTLDNINKDTQNPPANAVPAKLQITDGIMASAFTTSSGAYAWYISSFTEQEFGTGNSQLMKVELRNPIEIASSTTFNNEWGGTYSNLLNLKQIIEKCETKGGRDEGYIDLIAMAQTLMAYNYGVLTDLHGDIPCSEALQGLANLQPNVDKQEDIYNNTVLALLDKAIANFTIAIANKMKNAGSQDILFGNDNRKWLASAYALKARYLLHTCFRNNTVYTQVIEAANNAIANGFEGMDLKSFNGNATNNPWWSYYNSREYTGVTTTVADMMNDRNDARIRIYAIPYYYYGATYEQICNPGDKDLARETGGLSLPAWLNYQRSKYDPATPNGSDASVHIISKAELYFILAEAQARLGQSANVAFSTAIAASYADYEAFGKQFEPEYEAYIAKINEENEGKTDEEKAIPMSYNSFYDQKVTEYVKSLNAKYSTNALAEIMVQKYLSQCRDEQIETYNDIRRCKALGEVFIELKNPLNMQGGKNSWPERLPYGNSSVTANPKIKKLYGNGSYVFSEKIWLFGGTR